MSDAPEATDAAPRKKKGKKLIIIAGALVLAGGTAGGLFAAGIIGGHAKAESGPKIDAPKLVPKSEQPRVSGGGEGGKDGGTTTSGTPLGSGGDKYASTYYAMDKDFTSNLQDSVHFLQVGVAVDTPYDERVIDNVKTHEIAVRSAILMALGDTTEDEVFTAQGKKHLQGRLAAAINQTLKQKEGFGGIGNVYFTNFVVQ